ncbi:MAG: pyruvate dehydrogenase (acetyl-transferring), homodimeric type [Holophagales bacterium]|nr:pyruvate dehydrogenase (acetyl-transferring), homodimeric type [Holophagales bacterium]
MLEKPAPDIDPEETREWLVAFDDVLRHDGAERARFLLEHLLERSRKAGAAPGTLALSTPYVNTLPPEREAEYPGDRQIERNIRVYLRWNAMAMVVKANKEFDGLGGHIATYQSSSNLFEVGFQHFWHAAGKTVDGEEHGGDLVYFQGHASPGLYARFFLEGRLTEEDLDWFRRESRRHENGKGLSSYPHPWLMPDLWQFATVSMGLGLLMAIYQARFLRHLHHRGMADTAARRVWAFCGDGEMDEPESQGALTLAGREKLDNLIVVVNCNLQRLDGPVRGNGKIVQELEQLFRGAGWAVIKLLWGEEWDPLLRKDHDGRLVRRMLEAPDGEWQNYGAVTRGGAYFREKFFGKDPELLKRVEHLSDDDLMRLRRGGHDERKIYNAYKAAHGHQGQPTVILAHTIKGYGMGEAGEGLNIAHQQKKLGPDDLRYFRERYRVPISEEDAQKLTYLHPGEDSDEIRYLRKRRAELGGPFPVRRRSAPPLPVPGLEVFSKLLESTGERELSTTMAFVRALTSLTREKGLKKHLVPILVDEARTFGMEGMFRPLGIYALDGQQYEPVDSEQLSYYKESQTGQILQEGITEAGGIASWIAAGTSYSNSGVPMIPFYIFYSMFGFQRVGDFIWAGADMRARGFLLGGTSGRTTLNGEGLQHEDGHSHLIAATVPTCRAYDPTFHYELAVILQHGLERMYGEADENVFYYLTVMNESYVHPAMPEGAEEGIKKGLYSLRRSPEKGREKRVQLLGSGTILLEVLEAAELLEADWGVAADVWSAPSFTELRREGLAVDRHNLLRPEAEAEKSWVARCLEGEPGPVIAATDYMKAFADQIRNWVPGRYVVLGTDGFGRSDTREALRHFFEVDRHWITVAALRALAEEGAVPKKTAAEALERYGLDPEKADPTTV